MHRLVLLLSPLLVATNGMVLPFIDGRIVGGEDAAIEEVPYQAGLILDNQIICGGSILSENVVVSAAHCVVADESSYSIRVGSNTNYKPNDDSGQIIAVWKIEVHPEYKRKDKDFDAALFFLSSSLMLGAKVSQIRLPAQDQEIADNELAVTSGWGSLKYAGSSPLLLQKVTIPIIEQNVCASKYSAVGKTVTPRMICAGLLEEGGKDACQGDSGGPLVIAGILVGITSWGIGCAVPGKPGVWTRVPAISNWIENHLL